MLTEKVKKIKKEMESYFKQIGEKYDILSLETVIYFLFKPAFPEEDYDITVTPGIVLERDFLTIIVRMDYDFFNYDKILPVLNDLNNNLIFKYQINEELNQIEVLYTIQDLDFFIPGRNRIEYIWNLLSQMVMSFPEKNIFSRVFC